MSCVCQSWELDGGVSSSLGAAGVLFSTSFEPLGFATGILVGAFQILKCIYGHGSASSRRRGVVLLAAEVMVSFDPFIWAR